MLLIVLCALSGRGVRRFFPHAEGAKDAKAGRQTRRSVFSVNFIRYADDFVVTAASKQILEQNIKAVIVEFLRERGLKLSEEETLIRHKAQGLNFLGQRLPGSDGRGRMVRRRWAYPTALELAKDWSGCSLSRRTGEGQGEGSFCWKYASDPALVFAHTLILWEKPVRSPPGRISWQLKMRVPTNRIAGSRRQWLILERLEPCEMLDLDQ